MKRSLVVASYNIHSAVGNDRRFDPPRIAAVLAEIGADVVALQEVGTRVAGFDTLEFLRKETGWHAITGPTFRSAHGDFGNAVLTRLAPLSSKRIDLNVHRREPRGALDAVVDCGNGKRLRVVATHLGLRARERQTQVTRLLELIEEDPVELTLLLGDINEWLPRRGCLRLLHAHFGPVPVRRTFPSRLPVFALDRIWIKPPHALREVRVHASKLARIASDHLPLVAILDI